MDLAGGIGWCKNGRSGVLYVAIWDGAFLYLGQLLVDRGVWVLEEMSGEAGSV